MARVYMYAENATEARRCAMVVIDAHKNRNVFPWADKNDVLNEKKEIVIELSLVNIFLL